jgi:hypothetical protein
MQNYYTFSHCFAATAFFNLLRKVDCPPCLKDKRIWASDMVLLSVTELDELELVVVVGMISLGKSAPHISH